MPPLPSPEPPPPIASGACFGAVARRPARPLRLGGDDHDAEPPIRPAPRRTFRAGVRRRDPGRPRGPGSRLRAGVRPAGPGPGCARPDLRSRRSTASRAFGTDRPAEAVAPGPAARRATGRSGRTGPAGPAGRDSGPVGRRAGGPDRLRAFGPLDLRCPRRLAPPSAPGRRRPRLARRRVRSRRQSLLRSTPTPGAPGAGARGRRRRRRPGGSRVVEPLEPPASCALGGQARGRLADQSDRRLGAVLGAAVLLRAGVDRLASALGTRREQQRRPAARSASGQAQSGVARDRHDRVGSTRSASALASLDPPCIVAG